VEAIIKPNLEYFIAERAEHLAIVHLTRSQNLAIERLNADYGLDLLASISRDESPTGRIFGIQRETGLSTSQNSDTTVFNDLNPWTQSLIGVIQLESGESKDAYIDYLEEKYS
jgi:hypothetical protein